MVRFDIFYQCIINVSNIEKITLILQVVNNLDENRQEQKYGIHIKTVLLLCAIILINYIILVILNITTQKKCKSTEDLIPLSHYRR